MTARHSNLTQFPQNRQRLDSLRREIHELREENSRLREYVNYLENIIYGLNPGAWIILGFSIGFAVSWMIVN